MIVCPFDIDITVLEATEVTGTEAVFAGVVVGALEMGVSALVTGGATSVVGWVGVDVGEVVGVVEGVVEGEVVGVVGVVVGDPGGVGTEGGGVVVVSLGGLFPPGGEEDMCHENKRKGDF